VALRGQPGEWREHFMQVPWDSFGRSVWRFVFIGIFKKERSCFQRKKWVADFWINTSPHRNTQWRTCTHRSEVQQVGVGVTEQSD
jgi:hypothetical protein